MLALDIRGSGPAVVFLHGTPTLPNVFDDLASAISARFTAVQIALPGYGESAPLHDGWTHAELHEVLEHALIADGFRDVSLVGFSGGGYHSLALAARKVLTVRRVVSIAGFATLTGDERARYAATANVVEDGVDLLEPLHAAFFADDWASRPGMIDVTRSWIAATSPSYVASELRQIASCADLLPALASVEARIVARHGTADATIPVSKSEDIARAARHGRFEPVEGRGHALLLEDREGTWTAIERALTDP
jgi:pimeloyl-ACP methyl ester carboxylesterase